MYYFANDYPGSVVGMIDASGNLDKTYGYRPFGTVHDSTGTPANSLHFGARELDGETGLYSLRARYYDPSLGRFISEDPLGLAGGINLYRYSNNDPINAVDPYGLECTTAWGSYVTYMAPLGVTLHEYSFLICADDGGEGGGALAPPSTLPEPGTGNGGGTTAATKNGPDPQEKAKQLGKKLLACTLDHYGLTGLAIRAASWTGMAPLSKRWLGVPVAEGASEFTNPISYFGLKFFPGLKIGRQILGTNRVFGLIGRANIVLGTALLAYDAISIGVCVAQQ
jgi:RHS repeat-associated protein